MLREFINKLLENSTSTYEYGAIMLYYSFPQLVDLQKLIKPEDIYVEEGDKTYGLEDEPHCTLLSGIHSGVSLGDIKSIMDGYKFGGSKLYNPSSFIKDRYDVLKFDVMGGPLVEVNKELVESIPHTTDYPNFHPHLTIGYLQPGTAKRYIEAFNKEGINEFDLIPEYGLYSDADNVRSKINLNFDGVIPTNTNQRTPPKFNSQEYNNNNIRL